MSYTQTTRKRVEVYLEDKGEVVKTELLYLGEEKRQVNPGTLALIIEDLLMDKKISIRKIKVSKSRIFTLVKWRRK